MMSGGRKVRILVDRPRASARAMLSVMTWMALGSVVPIVVSAQDYPAGAWASGVVSQVTTINGMLRFVVSGTVDNGTSGTQAFWIDSAATGGSLRAANILSAAAQGKTVSIWNYGDFYSYGGQTGYLSQGEWTNY
jgi:hypothetical protein